MEPTVFERALSPLHYAGRGGHAHCVTLLLQAKANAGHNWNSEGRATPLMLAASNGHTAVVEALIPALTQRQIDMHHPVSMDTSLTMAIASLHDETVWSVSMGEHSLATFEESIAMDCVSRSASLC